MKSNHSKSNHFKRLLVLSAGITLPVMLSWGQERPGIECGCNKYDKYMEPASKAPSVKQGATPETGYSSENKYVIEAVDAMPPNVSNITIYYQGTMIFNESSTATGWGFSPDEDRFLMHGRDQFGSHWCLLANLDPDPSVEGEWSTQKMVVEPTNVSSEVIRFSPHGKYLLYAAISGTTSGLLLNVFDAKTFENVYDGSTGSLVGQPLDGVSVAGWGFSSDIKDATFMHTYLTDVNRYALCVVNLHKRPYQNVIIPAEVSYGQAYFRFSPCGDYFAWIWDSPYQDLTCELYRTNLTDSHEDVSAEQFWYLYSDADGQYIKYKDDTSEKIDENNADDDCDDVTKPIWENAVLDTGTVEGVQMELEWSGATDAGGVSAYRILKKDELDNYELIKEIETVNSCWITGLTPSTEYSFKILAGDEVGNWSTDGPTGMFTTFSDSPPDWNDISLTYSDQTETRIKLFWNDAHDDYSIKSYRILTDTTVRGMVGKDTLKYTIMGLTAGTEYTFIVEAGDEAGQWIAGLDQLTLTMLQPACPEWTGGAALSNSDITETSFHVSWPEVQDVYLPGIKYKVYMEGDSIALKKFYDRDLYVEDLEAGTSYFFEVVAIDESGNLSEALDGYLSTRPSFVVDTLVFGPGNQKRPDIDDNLVVWWDDRNDDGDIWSYDLITDEIKRITDDPRVQYQPAVSDGRIVWTDNRNDVGDIYMYDSVLQEEAICTADGMQDEPAIEGNIIVWRDSRSGNFDIYMYDLLTSQESPVSTHQSNQVSPDVTKDFIVYADDRNGDWDIFLYNIYTKKERAICTRDGDQTEPTITGTNIANTVVTYTDGGDIYRYNLYHLGYEEPFETEVPLDNWPFISEQSNAHFEDNLLVYQDLLGVNDGINHNIYAYKYRSSVDYYGESGFPVSIPVLETDQINPRTSKENIVWQFIKNDNSDIYVWKRPGGSDLSLSVEEITDPVMVGDTLIYNLKVTNLGPNNNLRIKTTVALPVKAKFVSAVSGKDTVVKEGNSIIWKIDTLNYESEAILEIALLAYEIAVLDLSAITEGEAFETDPSNNSLSESTKVKNVFPHFVGEGGWPALVAEGNGRVHLTYFDNNKLMYAVKERSKKKWQFRTLGYCPNARFIAMAMAPDRSLHIIYSDLFDNYYGYNVSLSLMHHGVLAANGEWTSKPIGANYVGSHSLSLDVSESGELYLAWQEARGAASPGNFWFRKTLNGVWQEPQLIDEYGYDHIDLAVDNEENTHLSFYSLKYGFAYQKWTGDQPGLIELVEPHWKGAQLEGMVTSIETDENNNPHISYAGQVNDDSRENIKYAWKQGGVWHNVKVDDGYYYSAGNQIALVPDGPANFGYSHFPSQQIRFSSLINGQWARQIVAEEITGYQTELSILGWELDLAMDNDGYGHMAFGGVNYTMIPPLVYFNTDPDTLDFGAVAIGSSKTLTFNLYNPLDQNINIDAVEIDDPRFSFSKTSFILPRFGEESIDVTFTQDDKGTEVKTRLRIMYNEPSGLMVDIPVEVKSWQSMLVADPERIDFGAVPLNNIAEKTLYIRNDGPVDLIISEIYRSGIPPGSFIQCDFSIASENCDTLGEGETCEILLNFKPTDPGSQSKPLIVKSNDPNSPFTIIGMYGKTPSPNISCSSYEIDFGYCQSGETLKDTLHLSNIGDAVLNISGITIEGIDADQFSFTGSCTSIDPGNSCDIYLMMIPTREDDFNATLTITSDSDFGNVRNVYLSGASSLKELTVSTDLIDFGEVALSENKEVLLELHNAGSYPIIIEAATSIEGADPCEFGHEFQFESWNPVAPGATVTDKIIFHPIYEGNKTAILKIGSNDSDEPVKIVTLKGSAKGINPLAASVSADPRLGIMPLPVQFQSIVTGGQPPYAFSWDFDDWEKSTERSPFHEFRSIGTYNVLFTAIDISGDMVTANIEIAVAAEGTPVVIITALPDYGEIPLTVQFTADTTGGVAPLSFSWEFGDGATSTLKDPSHTYTVPGNYIAKVTVTDADGATGTDTKEIKVISNNSISGELWNESGMTNIDRANVILYPQENTDDTIQIKLQGSYTYLFPGLESGNYTVLAVPDTIEFPGELPTYLGDKLALFEAEWTSVSGHVTGKNIHLISKPEGSAGTGSISGEMVEGTKKGLTITESTGHIEAEAVPGTYVYLKGSTDGNLKDFDVTASDGSFSFNDLINGSYYFVADYQGKPMDAANTPLVLSDERKDIEILATVGAESINVQDLGTGVWDLTSGNIKVYPVPAGDHIFLLIPEGIFTQKAIRISITDLSGRFVYINQLFDLSADPITLNIADIPEGVFVMQMTDNNIIYTLKVVKMK